MTVNEVWVLIESILNKYQHGVITPDVFNSIMTQSQYSYVDFLLGQYPKYQPGRPLPAVGIGETQRIRQSLSPLIDSPVTLTINPITGQAPFPTGLLACDAMYDSSMGRIRFVQQDSLYSYLDSVIDPIETNPIFLIEKGKFKFYPITQGTALLSFLATPPDVVWGFTEDVNGLMLYDINTSTDPVFQNDDMMNVIVRALRMIGVNLQFAEISQYANEIKNNGQ